MKTAYLFVVLTLMITPLLSQESNIIPIDNNWDDTAKESDATLKEEKPQAEMTGRDYLQMHIDAIGGDAALSKIKQKQEVALVKLTTTVGGKDYITNIRKITLQKSPREIYTASTAQGGSISSTETLRLFERNYKNMEGGDWTDAGTSLESGINDPGSVIESYDFLNKDCTIELLESITINGVDLYGVRIPEYQIIEESLGKGAKRITTIDLRYYMFKETNIIAFRQENKTSKTYNKNGSLTNTYEVMIATELSDWRTLDGVLYPYHSEVIVNGKRDGEWQTLSSMSTNIEQLTFKPNIDEAYFKIN